MSDDHAMTRGELAARIGVSPHWVSRNVPAALFIGGRIHWHEYCAWRSERYLAAIRTVSSIAAEVIPTLAGAHIFGGQWLSNGRTSASRAPAEYRPHDSE